MTFEIFNHNKENLVGHAGKHQEHVGAGAAVLGEIKHFKIFNQNKENKVQNAPGGKRSVLGEIKEERNQLEQQDQEEDQCQAFNFFSDDENFNFSLTGSPSMDLCPDTSVANVDDFDVSFASTENDWDEAPEIVDDAIFNVAEIPTIVDDVLLNVPATASNDITEDLDQDYLTAPEYKEDIYTYLRSLEPSLKPRSNYMTYQPDVTHTMRSIMVDWLVEVAVEYKLNPTTLHLTISFIDRFMSVMAVERSKLQLVGAVAMYIAAKVEEIHPPHVSDFVYITDDAFTVKQMLRMEQLILTVLKFRVSGPTSYGFVTKFCIMFGLSARATSLATYLNELTLLDGETFLKFSSSLVAAGCVAVARDSLGEEAWNDDMAVMAGYVEEDLEECSEKLKELFKKAGQHQLQATRGKYKTDEFHNVAFFVPQSKDDMSF